MTLGARITGVGRYLPERILANSDLERMVATNDEWITERSGIRERRIAAPNESTSTMGAEAARLALASARLDASEVDLVVVGTCTADHTFPAAAALIQHQIGATSAAAFDVNSACTGFLSALSTGAQHIATGASRRTLVIGSETMSRIVDWTDRDTCVLFGDGAGAVVLEPSEAGEPGGIESLLLRSDGSQANLLYATGPCMPLAPGEAAKQEATIIMDGRAVFRSAVTEMARTAADALDRAGLTVDDIALCVPHQANLRILTAMARSLALPMERVYVNLDRTGNTSSASIPIALAEANDEGRLQPGDRVLLAAFGGGLSWGATVVEWSGVRQPATAHDPTTVAAAAVQGH